MKIAIVSDTHGKWQSVKEAIAQEEVQYLFFLGDFAEDGRHLAQQLKIPAEIVRGNCDDLNTAAQEVIITLCGVDILLCHGDRHHVKETLEPIHYYGLEKEVDIICFGHSHEAVYEAGEVIMINPGSAHRSKAPLDPPSWGLLEIDESEKKIKKYTKKDLPKV